MSASVAQLVPLDAEEAVRSAIRRVERSVARATNHDPEDIVQEALLRAVRNGVSCDAEPWLRTVARRIAIDRARCSREDAAGSSFDMEDLKPAPGAGPEDIAISNETFSAIRKALDKMPRRYRDALLAYVEEQDTDSVARRFGISAGATWSLLCRARARLRLELDRAGYAFGGIVVRLRQWHADVAVAGTAMAVAAAVTLAGTPKPADHLGRVPASPTTSIVATSANIERARPFTGGEVVPLVRQATQKVVKTVENETAVAHYAVAACVPLLPALPVKADVTIVDGARRSLVAEVVKRLPDQLTNVDVGRCVE